MRMTVPRETTPRQLAEMHHHLALAWRSIDAAVTIGAVDGRSTGRLEALRERAREAMDTLALPFVLATGEVKAPRPDPLNPLCWHQWLDIVESSQTPPTIDDDVF